MVAMITSSLIILRSLHGIRLVFFVKFILGTVRIVSFVVFHLLSYAFILQVFVVIIAIIGVTIYRSIMTGFLGRYELIQDFSMTIASLTATCIHLVIIIILGQFYQLLAYRLTEWGKY